MPGAEVLRSLKSKRTSNALYHPGIPRTTRLPWLVQLHYGTAGPQRENYDCDYEYSNHAVILNKNRGGWHGLRRTNPTCFFTCTSSQSEYERVCTHAMYVLLRKTIRSRVRIRRAVQQFHAPRNYLQLNVLKARC